MVNAARTPAVSATVMRTFSVQAIVNPDFHRASICEWPKNVGSSHLIGGSKPRVRFSTISRIAATIRKPRPTAVGQPEWMIRDRSRKCVKLGDRESVSFPSRPGGASE